MREHAQRLIRLLSTLLGLAIVAAGCGQSGQTGSPHESIVAPSSVAPVQVADPAAIDIPQINAHSTLIPLGLNTDPAVGPIGAMQSPDLHTPKQAGYYARGGVRAGQPGPPLVVSAHVNGYGVNGLFYRLKDLRPDDVAQVKLSDGTTLTFRVTAVESDPKTAFPAAKVFGPSNHATLVMVTCGGSFDAAARSYRSNIVAYADLVA